MPTIQQMKPPSVYYVINAIFVISLVMGCYAFSLYLRDPSHFPETAQLGFAVNVVWGLASIAITAAFLYFFIRRKKAALAIAAMDFTLVIASAVYNLFLRAGTPHSESWPMLLFANGISPLFYLLIFLKVRQFVRQGFLT
ncbi:MAG: hypothetical protein ACXWQO_11375 [Bdellovibrionota bacterium]